MKKVILALALLASVPAFAQHHGHYGHHGHHGGYRGPGWGSVVGGMILGAVVYDIYNRPVVVQQPVIVQQPPVVYQSQPNCGPWKEVQSQDGTIYRERTCTQ
jgi:hypothetical protein